MKEEMSDFLKQAYKSGRIIDYDDFCKTPQAKKYALNEEEVEYYTELSKRKKKYKVGDIVYVEGYKYKNGESGKRHSFVIIEEGQAIAIDYFGFLISSKIEKSNFPYNEKINKNITNNLYRDSIVKCDDLIVISEKDIKFKIGEVTEKELKKFKETYMKYLEEI